MCNSDQSEMLFITCVLIAGFTRTGLVGATASEWTYEHQDQWYPRICIEGPHQSPIALSTSVAEESSFTPFRTYGYKTQIPVIVQNNGHSVKIKPKNSKDKQEIHKGGMPDNYILDHLHFHWHSEHTMDGERFPLEMHMVHYAARFESYEKASKHTEEGGLAVFAVLFYLSPDDVEAFEPVIEAVRDIYENVNHEKELNDFVMADFMPMDKSGFYRYNGSLTTPGCDEGIIWTVFMHTLPISKSQVDGFRMIRTSHHVQLTENFRELQNLNDRPILIKYSPMKDSGSNYIKSKANMYLFALLLLTISYLMR
ncbi:unnamed protein product [Phyllotreta striolata]|uniref:Carbonic anhydrase n=1 Tax=Phyllotreta striolata TaxID=444603 RepID=A0A9N9TJ59_PHYSR|nr:unnamed protein product [Phyllotreta striolata]